MNNVEDKLNNKAVGAEFTRLREQRGWSIEELADRAMWIDEEIEAIEDGVELPLGYLDRVAKVLGVSLEKLYEEAVSVQRRAALIKTERGLSTRARPRRDSRSRNTIRAKQR